MPGPLSATVSRTSAGAGIVLRLDRDHARSIHRFDGVVDEIDDDAANLLAVHAHLRQVVREAPLESSRRPAALVERQRLVQQRVQIGGRGARRRHARELRELVDQRLQRIHFADDRRRCTPPPAPALAAAPSRNAGAAARRTAGSASADS